MWARVLVGIAGLTGCLIVPRTEHTPHHVTDEVANIVPPAAAMGLEVMSAGGTITMRASQPRVCRRETWSVVDVRHEKTADLEVDLGSGNDGYAVVFAVILAPVTLLVSGIVTGIIVAADKPSMTRERHKIAAVPYECPVFGGSVAVTLVFPSGGFVELTTDRDGVASFVVPAEEPDAGVIEVKANALGPRRVSYDRARTATIVDTSPPLPQVQTPSDERAACIEQRRQLMLSAQQVSDAKERGRLLLALPVCPAK